MWFDFALPDLCSLRSSSVSTFAQSVLNPNSWSSIALHPRVPARALSLADSGIISALTPPSGPELLLLPPFTGCPVLPFSRLWTTSCRRDGKQTEIRPIPHSRLESKRIKPFQSTDRVSYSSIHVLVPGLNLDGSHIVDPQVRGSISDTELSLC